MKRLIYCFFLCGLLFSGCVKDPDLSQVQLGEGEVWVNLDFGHTDFDEVQITTRSTLGQVAESRVSNLYVFLFDQNGNRVAGHFFDNSNKRDSHSSVISANVNCWMVDNQLNSTEPKTTGTIRMKVPQLTGGEICIVANLDTDIFSISSEMFGFIQTRDELMEMVGTLNHDTTDRTGRFPMTGDVTGITVSQTGITSSTGDAVSVSLFRVDAKIEVRVRAAVGNESSVTTTDGETVQRIKSFTPESWQVINLPRGSYLFERDAGTENHDADAGLFNSYDVAFESQTLKTFTYVNSSGQSVQVEDGAEHGFSFYMYENRPECKKSVNKNYHLRDRRNKNAAGAYDTTNGLWEYAPETATYLIVKGQVAMDVDVGVGAPAQTLNADVVYYIHLGDIRTSMDDYSVNRNTHYIYTITIKGVENIQVEVSTNVENESGATGHVYIAKESVYTFDAHYGQRVFVFDQENITPEDVTWYVKTPFGREGMPERVNGVEIPNGLDYKWVWFRVNEIDTSTDQYSKRNRSYHPDEVMDVLEFCQYMREQKTLFDQNLPNDFREEEDPELKQQYPDHPEIYRRYRIYVTIFVDEFYYDRDPISGEVRPTLWKEFVNQDNRMMHILCDTQFSADGDSSATGSVVTIRQRSIQSVYDKHLESLNTGWGCEVIDESEGILWFYNRNETYSDADAAIARPNYGNNSRSNGLYNTARLWQLTDGNGGFNYRYWTDYLDYDRENDYNLIFLKDQDDLATARYTCLMRNRDNNGNNVIDPSEVRWYIASIQQLTALYVGDGGIHEDAWLYDRYNNYGVNETNANGAVLWRLHVVSSTLWGKDGNYSNYPTMLWAEEGLSTSAYQQYANVKPGRYAVRCVRNLGMDPATEQEAVANLNDADKMPDFSVVFETVNETNDKNSVYRFNLTRINKKSIRSIDVSGELDPSDEYSPNSRTYSAFETGPEVSYASNYPALKTLLENGESPCPEGYRVPNIREASLMSNYITADVNSNWWSEHYTFVSTFYSFGQYGKRYEAYESSWYCRDGHVTIAKPDEASVIRCVRDIEIE